MFSILAKTTQLTFILDRHSIYKMNDGPNKKNCLPAWKMKQKKLWMKQIHEYTDETKPFLYLCTPLFWCFLPSTHQWSISVLQQYSLAFSELSKHLRWSLLRKQLREKVNFPLKIYSFLMISGDGSREGVLQRLTNSLTIASN